MPNDTKPFKARKPTIISLQDARLSYPSSEGEVAVIKGLDLKIHEGEILAVMGPSGSGKSSLIALIGGLERATGGKVEVLGRDLTSADEAERTDLRRRDVGIVFQSYHLVPAMTALQNAALTLTLAGHADAEQTAAKMLERVGLGHRLTHRPSALSGGEQQRVAIARAFAAGPRLVLADEPTGNLDQETGADVAETMFDLVHGTGAAMLMVTHDPVMAKKCDRTVRIDAGIIRT